MAASPNELKSRVLAILDTLPDEALPEVASFLEYQRFKLGQHEDDYSTPYRPVRLGGLWAGIEISDEDIAEARRDMWAKFTDADS